MIATQNNFHPRQHHHWSISGRTPVRLTYGIHTIKADLAGLTVAETKLAYKGILNVGGDAEAYLNGQRAAGADRLQAGDRLEFVKGWGVKGGDGDILGETLLTLSQAARRLPRVRGNKPLSPGTLFRWINVGLKSRSGKVVKLEAWLIGGTRCTSVEALERLFQRLDDLEPPKPLVSHQDRKLKKQTDEALDILRSRGIMGDGE